MTKFDKLQANKGLTKDDGVAECLSIKGVIIDLRDISPTLRDRYRSLQRAMGRAEKIRVEMDALTSAVLSEQAIKLSPRLNGHDAVAKLMGLKRR